MLFFLTIFFLNRLDFGSISAHFEVCSRGCPCSKSKIFTFFCETRWQLFGKQVSVDTFEKYEAMYMALPDSVDKSLVASGIASGMYYQMDEKRSERRANNSLPFSFNSRNRAKTIVGRFKRMLARKSITYSILNSRRLKIDLVRSKKIEILLFFLRNPLTNDLNGTIIVDDEGRSRTRNRNQIRTQES